MRRIRCLFTLVVMAVWLCALVTGRGVRTFEYNDDVLVFAGKMNPSGNPYETYRYIDAPGCPLLTVDQALTVGELLAGDNSYILQTNIHFNNNVASSVLCKYKATEEDVEVLRSYIKKRFEYELTVDDMPVWGSIGSWDMDRSEYYIDLHRTFYIGVNKDQIVNVTLRTGNPVKLEPRVVYEFTYSVIFESSSVEYANRFSTVFGTRHASSRTRIVSVINSVLIIFFLLCVIMLVITRALRSDLAKMEQEAQLGYDGHDIIDESGWRCLYADVFRVPKHTSIFCGILGCGSQLLVLASLAIMLSVVTNYRISMNRNLVTYTVLGYAFTSGIAGYVSGYQFMGCGLLAPPMASKWIRAFHVTFMIAPLTYAVAFVPSSLVAILYQSAQLPYLKGIIIVLFLEGFIAYPLCLAGVLCSRYIFRRTERRRNIPHVNQIPRLIPRPPRKLLAPHILLLASGALPFMSIFVEFSFVFHSLWSYKFFHLYGFLVTTTVLYVAVTACVSVAATFLLLTTENHHWQWMSIGFGASCSLYASAYAGIFYLFSTTMHGLYMWVVYVSYCVMFSLFLAILGGTVGYFSASFFVKKIYGQSKHD
ncbi:putative endomembrane protein [Leptomonas pyrrhocoris]|uniref:Transmembrane 9 superfamily member n=1 Tax=Leptomonas pyrrhocoris TaxID=157538 RepID=A0A0M9FUK0_LEPPY|nr:putative endomembrane protein [Leptomonas pyrrhocoris]KPA76385.1 putative endomembrane protein [Leptomonas pyrrhocoris]|eukprot:XP_015654824.1 putative endomembrane protein [Leptomonas pyrrhocoris]